MNFDLSEEQGMLKEPARKLIPLGHIGKAIPVEYGLMGRPIIMCKNLEFRLEEANES